MLKRLGDWLALTKTERNVILFLTSTFLAGTAVRLFQETFPSSRGFDYRKSDSTFAALSAGAISSEAGEQQADDYNLTNLNRASKSQLMKLPGIGEITAERIITYRRKFGPFKSAEDLKKIKGMSAKKLDRIK
ncbi:MAG: ComEA family DNA-binding protein, partial [Candidatus Omnitrophota bacterium]